MRYEIMFDGNSWIYTDHELRQRYPTLYTEIRLKAQQYDMFTVGDKTQLLVIVLGVNALAC